MKKEWRKAAVKLKPSGISSCFHQSCRVRKVSAMQTSGVKPIMNNQTSEKSELENDNFIMVSATQPQAPKTMPWRMAAC